MEALMDVAEASAELGVSPARVRALCSSGSLAAQRKSGRWLIDPAAVASRVGRQPAGRPPAAATVWNLLAMMDGRSGSLSAREFDRALHLAISAGDPLHNRDGWRRILARRADEVRVRVHPGVLDRLVKDKRVQRGGIAAAQVDLAGSGVEHLYVPSSQMEEVLSKYRATPDSDGQVVLHLVPNEVAMAGSSFVGAAVGAADLLNDPDPRAVSAATAALVDIAATLPSR